jgi:hypothetical protein
MTPTDSDATEKLARVRGWLAAAGHDVALFASQPGVAWVTGGLEDKIVRNEEPGLVWALVTADDASLVTTARATSPRGSRRRSRSAASCRQCCSPTVMSGGGHSVVPFPPSPSPDATSWPLSPGSAAG